MLQGVVCAAAYRRGAAAARRGNGATTGLKPAESFGVIDYNADIVSRRPR